MSSSSRIEQGRIFFFGFAQKKSSSVMQFTVPVRKVVQSLIIVNGDSDPGDTELNHL